MDKFLFRRLVKMVAALSLASVLLLLWLLLLNNSNVAHATPPIEENPVSAGDALDIVTTSDRVRAVGAGDLDRNGRPDLVLADGNQVVIVANTGITTPVWSPSATVGSMSASVVDLAMADMDRDGRVDLVAVAADVSGDSQLVLWRSPITTTGSFTATWTVSNTLTSTARITLTTLAVGDLDRDGALDVVAAGRDGLIRLWHNPLTGTQPFTTAWGSPTVVGVSGEEINQVMLADFDRDGCSDIVTVISDTSSSVRLWQNPMTGAQPFTTPWVVSNTLNALGSAGMSVAVADFDGNGTLDIAAGDAAAGVTIWSNPLTGTQSFATAWGSPVSVGDGGDSISALSAGDFDNDGQPDLVGGTEGAPSTVLIWRNPGTPFAGAWPTAAVGTRTDPMYDLVVADFEPDGDVDIVSGEGSAGSGNVTLWPNLLIHRDAAFDHTSTAVGALGYHDGMMIGDFDRDGRPDVLCRDGDGNLVVFENSGSPFGSGWPRHEIAPFAGVRPLAVADINRDGTLEIIAGSTWGTARLEVWHATGAVFESSWDEQIIGNLPFHPQAADVDDVDGDGRPEVVVATNAVWVWQYDGDPFASTWISAEVGVVTYTVGDLTLGDLNSDGRLDIALGTAHAWAVGSESDPRPQSEWIDAYQLRAFRNDGAPFAGGWTAFDLGRDPATRSLEVMYHGYFGANINSVDVADFNNDGNLDIVTGEDYVGDYQVIVWENDGSPFDGQLWSPTTVGLGPDWETQGDPWLADTVNSVVAADMNNDGFLDVVSGSDAGDYGIIYWENSSTPFGEMIMDTDWIRHNVGLTYLNGTVVATADLDGDGDMDVVSHAETYSADVESLRAWQNQGGSVGQVTADTAPAAYLQGTTRELMRIAVSHHGKAVDHDVELAEWRLTLRDITGTILTSTEADALFANLVVYRDANGDGVWQAGDTPVVAVATPVLTDGVQTLPFTHGDELAAISATQAVTYFVVATLESDASAQTPSAFQMIFDPDAASVVRNRINGASVSINDTRPITVGPVQASGPVASVGLTADPPSILAGGVSTSVLTATALDAHNQWAADGTVVTFATSLGTLPAEPYTATTAGGVAMATLTSSTSVGMATITATADSHIGTTIVTFTNVAPDAVDDSYTVNEDSVDSLFGVLANDTDANGDTLVVAGVGLADHGTVAFGSSVVTYTPDADFYGSDTFTYTVSDGHGGSDTATVSVSVTNVNDDPDAVDDGYTVDEDSADNALAVLGNDTYLPDPAETLIVTAVGLADHGTVAFGSSVVTYTPDADFYGSDTFTYTISDGHGGGDTATVAVTVSSVNDPPDAVNDTANTPEDTPRSIAVLGNDSDPDGDTFAVDAVGMPVNGSASTDGTTVTYTPTLNFNGTDTFTYTIRDTGGLTDTAWVTVTVGVANDAPNAVNDVTTTSEDTPVVIDVLVNDTDSNGDTLTVDTVGTPANGSVSTDGTTVTYTPILNFYGTDSFTYTVSDGILTDTATVSVTVTNVNDDPDAVDDGYTVDEDSTDNTLVVLGNDTYLPDPAETLTVVAVGVPDQGGSVVNNGSDVVYTPGGDFYGSDTFTYTISDGNGGGDTATVSVSVTNVNDDPDAVDDGYTVSEDSVDNTLDVLSNDTYLPDPVESLTVVAIGVPDQGGSVVNNGSDVVYTPDADFYGTEVFTYTISDGSGGVDIASVTMTVTSVNDPPDAVDDTARTDMGTPVTIDVLTNDGDIDGDTVSLHSFEMPVHGGSVTRDDNNTPGDQSDDRLVYAPLASFVGIDIFTYTISDDVLTDTATVSVTVTGLLDYIVVTPMSVTLTPGETQLFTARGYDQYNNEVSGLSFTWDVVNGGGVIDSSGVFTAGTVAGVYTDTVWATAEGITGTASVTITTGVLDHVVVDPPLVTLAPRETQLFTARGYDQYNNEVSGLSFTWDVVNGGGVIDSSGLFAAGTTMGVYTDTVRAAAEGISGYASVMISDEQHVIFLALVLKGS
jgi:hypothetical protein